MPTCEIEYHISRDRRPEWDMVSSERAQPGERNRYDDQAVSNLSKIDVSQSRYHSKGDTDWVPMDQKIPFSRSFVRCAERRQLRLTSSHQTMFAATRSIAESSMSRPIDSCHA